MSNWSTSTEVRDGQIVVSVLATSDPVGGLREFRPFLDVPLDETHALILFGELGLALQTLTDARKGDNVVRFPGGDAA